MEDNTKAALQQILLGVRHNRAPCSRWVLEPEDVILLERVFFAQLKPRTGSFSARALSDPGPAPGARPRGGAPAPPLACRGSASDSRVAGLRAGRRAHVSWVFSRRAGLAGPGGGPRPRLLLLPARKCTI